MNPYVRFLRALIRSSVTAPSPRDEPDHPAAQHPRAAARDRRISLLVAVVVPIVVGLILLPFRTGLGVSAAIIFVVPTLFVALARGPLGAIVAAVVSALAYNLLLTRPHYSLLITEESEVVAMVVLLVAGGLVGITSSHLRDMTEAAATRRTDVDGFMAVAAAGRSNGDLVEATCRSLTAILEASSTRWQPGYHGSVDPVLARDGSVAGHDDDALPANIEIPAVVGTTELGRFVVHSRDHPTSIEERAAALALVDVFARFAIDDPNSDSR